MCETARSPPRPADRQPDQKVVAVKVLLVSPLPPPYGGISHWTALVLTHVETVPGVDLRVTNIAPRRRKRLNSPITRRAREGASRMVTEVARFVWDLLTFQPDAVHLNTSGHLAF